MSITSDSGSGNNTYKWTLLLLSNKDFLDSYIFEQFDREMIDYFKNSQSE